MEAGAKPVNGVLAITAFEVVEAGFLTVEAAGFLLSI